MTDYAYSTAAEQAAAMDSGEVSAVELTTAAIARIEKLDGDINAICVRDFDRAFTAAREADAARSRGETGPVLGVPMTIKDSINVAGLPTTWGVRAFQDFVPADDAVAVARLRAAGAVILGKTNVSVGLGDFQPIGNNLLLRLQRRPNVLISPHIAYYTEHALSDIVENSLVNCLRYEGDMQHA
jgi:amidase